MKNKTKNKDLDNNELSKKNTEEKKKNENSTWFIKAFFITFILSLLFTYISTNGVSKLDLVPAIIILIVIILVGIMFDIIGVAVQVADEDEFHAKASKKVTGSKTSIKLIKNSNVVANICADVIGDVCGVLSGSLGALIAIRLTEMFGWPSDVQTIVGALVAALTVSGKALGKGLAKKNSTKIVHAAGKILNKFSFKKNK